MIDNDGSPNIKAKPIAGAGILGDQLRDERDVVNRNRLAHDTSKCVTTSVVSVAVLLRVMANPPRRIERRQRYPNTYTGRGFTQAYRKDTLQRRQAIVDATQKLMRSGVDFGKVPGTDRDVLLQPVADKLCNLFGLVIQYEVAKSEEDWTGERHGGTPFFFYEVRGRAYRGDFLMGEGVGSCSSWESKYRWRRAERICPQCTKANIRKSNIDGGWYCWTKTDGCGAKFAAGDAAIESQETGRKANPDMADVVNTVLKMAFKRSKVSTTINATSASEFFTQDVEEQGTPSTGSEHHGHRTDTGGPAYGTRGAMDNATERRTSELCGPSVSPESARKRWTNRGEMKRMFEAARERVGENVYLHELGRFGIQKAEDFRNENAAWSCYTRLADLVKEVV